MSKQQKMLVSLAALLALASGGAGSHLLGWWGDARVYEVPDAPAQVSAAPLTPEEAWRKQENEKAMRQEMDILFHPEPLILSE